MARARSKAQLDREIAIALARKPSRGRRTHHVTLSIRDKYSRAKGAVDGRTIRDGIPNKGSIDAELNDYEILPGVREVPFSAFDQMGPLRYYSVSESKRTKELAAKIRQSNEINPLIVVEDVEGPYVLEGGHRFDALRELKARAFPALVVLDLGSLGAGT